MNYYVFKDQTEQCSKKTQYRRSSAAATNKKCYRARMWSKERCDNRGDNRRADVTKTKFRSLKQIHNVNNKKIECSQPLTIETKSMCNFVNYLN